jgi:hypothetical protein
MRYRVGVMDPTGADRGMYRQISPEYMATFWNPRFPGQLPDRLSVASEIRNGGIDLEGHQLVPVKLGHTDTADSTCLHVPSLGLVAAGDAVHNGIHPYHAETSAQTRLDEETHTAEELYDRMLRLYPDRVNPGQASLQMPGVRRPPRGRTALLSPAPALRCQGQRWRAPTSADSSSATRASPGQFLPLTSPETVARRPAASPGCAVECASTHGVWLSTHSLVGDPSPWCDGQPALSRVVPAISGNARAVRSRWP